jgi:hypothetical protein
VRDDRDPLRPEQGREVAAVRRMTRMLVLYHYTSAEAAEAILCEGFQDGEGLYLTTAGWRGVWLSDHPLDSNDTGRLHRPPAWVRVSLDLPEEAIAEYEWVCEEGSYREWLIPAAIINAHATLAPYDKWADEDDAEDEPASPSGR